MRQVTVLDGLLEDRGHRLALHVAEGEVVVRVLVRIELLDVGDHLLHALDRLVTPLRALRDDPHVLGEVVLERGSAELVDPRRRLRDPLGCEAELGGGAPDRARVGRQRGHEDRVALRPGQRLDLAGHVLVALRELLGGGELEALLLGDEVDAFLAGLAVGVILGERADVLPLAAVLEVVVDPVDRLPLVGVADRQQVRLADPERVQRCGRGEDLVALELRQDAERDRGAEHLGEGDHVALQPVVALDGDVRLVLGVVLDELDLVLARDPALGVQRVEEDLVAVGQRVADDGDRPGER